MMIVGTKCNSYNVVHQDIHSIFTYMLFICSICHMYIVVIYLLFYIITTFAFNH